MEREDAENKEESGYWGTDQGEEDSEHGEANAKDVEYEVPTRDDVEGKIGDIGDGEKREDEAEMLLSMVEARSGPRPEEDASTRNFGRKNQYPQVETKGSNKRSDKKMAPNGQFTGERPRTCGVCAAAEGDECGVGRQCK
jgi:hypothetical protein